MAEPLYGVCDCELPCSCCEYRGARFTSWRDSLRAETARAESADERADAYRAERDAWHAMADMSEARADAERERAEALRAAIDKALSLDVIPDDEAAWEVLHVALAADDLRRAGQPAESGEGEA